MKQRPGEVAGTRSRSQVEASLGKQEEACFLSKERKKGRVREIESSCEAGCRNNL